MSTYEYRVRWRRGEEGELPRAPRTAILQTRQAAREKAARLKLIDAELRGYADSMPAYSPYKHLEGMPPLIGEPRIERRPVGEWADVPPEAGLG